jgi:hypothetical protein
MPIGSELGAFSCKATSFTYSPGEGGLESVEINYEGTIEGSGSSGTVLGTMNVSPSADAKNGTWTWCGREFAADGATRVANGGGFFQSSGTNNWKLRGYIHFSDGSSAATEGDLDLASRSLTGKLSEWD